VTPPAPYPLNDTITVSPGERITGFDVRANDVDYGYGPLTITMLNNNLSLLGTIPALTSTGVFSTSGPVANAAAGDTFTDIYRACNVNNVCGTAVLTVIVRESSGGIRRPT
jgi:hypothetical protein